MIACETDGPLSVITLNRPEKANALTHAMLGDILAAVRGCQEQSAVILTGAGKVFSAGADLDEVGGGLATDPVWEELSAAIAALPCLTIAALNGSLAGGAFGMALACDMRISVASARFFYPVMTLGFLPQPSDPARLARLVGPARAKVILMAAQKIDAETALRWGLIDEIAGDAVLQRAKDLTEAACGARAGHVGAIKDFFETH
ncbi:MAG: enoyl-CoA hydratase/isomerase family protein [Pseudomonadota bacterium]